MQSNRTMGALCTRDMGDGVEELSCCLQGSLRDVHMHVPAQSSHVGIIKGPVCHQARLVCYTVLDSHVVQDLLLTAFHAPDANLHVKGTLPS